MFDAPICIAIFINLFAWGTFFQRQASFIFLGIGLSRLFHGLF